MVAIVRDRHYEDPNNLLIVSSALADIVCTSTSLYAAISIVLDHGYSRGYTCAILMIFKRIIESHLIFILCIGCVWDSNSTKKKPLHIKQSVSKMKSPILNANVLQLNSPIAICPTDTQLSPNDIKTVHLTRNYVTRFIISSDIIDEW